MTLMKSMALAVAFALGGGVASAATIEYKDYTGRPTPNDCSGVFGQGFDECEDPRGSPVIAKWDIDEDKWEINSMFSDVLSSMFTVKIISDTTGNWTYDPGTCTLCTVVTSFVIKTGAGFRWYYTDPKEAIYSGVWDVSDLGRGQGISHITFYDTAPAPIPLPAGGLLLVTALGGLAIARRRKKV
ncbi:VPLPA-CTERM sorting domain-containing protein [Tabrizicola sp. WMC-M-20]|nr:VPLPA-CTERM sorting domain-containing protein [Tabrizicola sp. WMC-M-20]